MSGVYVLGVLDELVADMGDTPGTTGHQVAQVRDAVAELIEADLACDAAYAANDEAAFKAATKLRDAALARCRGGDA